ncbi:MAG: ATP-binding protein [Gemmatimonadaceae bacterium]
MADVPLADAVGASDDGLFESVTPPYVALDVEIPSDVKQIEPIVSLITEHCRTLHLPRRQCSLNIPVALSEALSNAIIRGNHEDPKKHVRLRATVSDRALVFDIVDEGRGFDMSDVSHDPTDEDSILAEDGRGVFLMRKLMDRVEQFTGPNNVVRLTLNR